MLWRGTSELMSYGDSTVFQGPDLRTSLKQYTLTPCLCLTSEPSGQVIESLIERDLTRLQRKAKSSAASAACRSMDGG